MLVCNHVTHCCLQAPPDPRPPLQEQQNTIVSLVQNEHNTLGVYTDVHLQQISSPTKHMDSTGASISM